MRLGIAFGVRVWEGEVSDALWGVSSTEAGSQAFLSEGDAGQLRELSECC